MRVLITGSDGFVGRHFKEALYDHELTLIDIKSGIDARDFFRHNETQYDLVIHLAAVVGGRAKIEGEPLSVAVDLSIDAEMFGWAIRTQPKHVVYFSSSAAYPTRLQTLALKHRLTESDIDLSDIHNPDLTYGWSKLTGEILAQHAEDAGVRVHVFRPFSGYGVDQDLDYPFPSFIDRARRKVKVFEIWGDGQQVRDWIHISDIVSATLLAVEYDVPGPINLGWGRATSFDDLAKLVMPGTPVKHLTDKPSGVSYRVSAASKMLSFYEPKISLEQGIALSLAKVR